LRSNLMRLASLIVDFVKVGCFRVAYLCDGTEQLNCLWINEVKF